MEKLSKLKLPKSAVALNGREMKAISGGYGWQGCEAAELCSGTCVFPISGAVGNCEIAVGSGSGTGTGTMPGNPGGPIGMGCVCIPN